MSYIFVICSFVFLSIMIICNTIEKIKIHECNKFYENYDKFKGEYHEIELSKKEKEDLLEVLKPTIDKINKERNK